jgi:hypothetical protein
MSDDIERPSFTTWFLAFIAAELGIVYWGFWGQVVNRPPLWQVIAAMVILAALYVVVYQWRLWKHRAKRQVDGDAQLAKVNGETLQLLPTWNSLAGMTLHKKIEGAVFVRRKIAPTDYVSATFRNYTRFLEFCPKQGKETWRREAWLVGAIQDPVVTNDLQREIEAVSVCAEGQHKEYQKVLVIVLVYRSLDIKEKGELLHQLEAVKANGGLSAKLSFQVWDKNDL